MLRRRVLVLVSLLGALLLVLAGPAWAHVTIDPAEAPQGGFATVRFRVPNERDDAATTSLKVEFPSENPIPSARVKPVPGWTATVETAPAPGGGEDDEGEAAEMVTRITWTGGPIAPGQFEEFPVSMGPLPDDTDQLVFPAIQTYDSGEVVRWIEEAAPGGEEPESPAPVLTLTASDDDAEEPENGGSETAAADTDGDSDDDDSNTLAVIALVVGALGLLTGIGALVQSRRSTS
jgi:uncharacterized protein YcnI